MADDEMGLDQKEIKRNVGKGKMSVGWKINDIHSSTNRMRHLQSRLQDIVADSGHWLCYIGCLLSHYIYRILLSRQITTRAATIYFIFRCSARKSCR